MEDAILSMLQGSLGDYADLGHVDASEFPVTLRNVRLREDVINRELDADGSQPFELSSGTIGEVTVSPGWMGTVDVQATNISLQFAVNPMKAMQAAPPARRPQGRSSRGMQLPADEAPRGFRSAGAVPASAMAVGGGGRPRFCSQHNSPASRPKGPMLERSCQACGEGHSSNYLQFAVCPTCSARRGQCMVCGTTDLKGARSAGPIIVSPPTQDEDSGGDSFEALRHFFGFGPFSACGMDATNEEFEFTNAQPVSA
mmetsp:Transcript_6467/g.11235  ORF Transcript_6467/g.11235 Transcript_6467/m.11235 type:complete len:256 (-) Transcript_6467:174-941(-)